MAEYYDWASHTSLEEAECVPFVEWMEGPGHTRRFAAHPEGFLIFLPPNDIGAFDEYSAGDPYAVSGNLNKRFHRQRVDLTIDLVSQALGGECRGQRILDVACGEGHITAAVHRAFPTAEILAFDSSISAIRRAHRVYEDITFAVANAYDPPYPPEYFDCLICNNIWEHIPDPLRLLKCTARSLKRGGHVIISTPSRYSLENLLRILVGKTVALGSPHHVTEYSIGQVFEQLRYGGFVVKKMAGNLLWPDKVTLSSLAKFVMGCLLAGILRINGSHHNLAATVFYLAKKNDQNTAHI